jgi:hypothetical protein
VAGRRQPDWGLRLMIIFEYSGPSDTSWFRLQGRHVNSAPCSPILVRPTPGPDSLISWQGAAP